MSLIQGKKHAWEVVIGLEIHAQVSSKTKLFSHSPTEFGAEPNTQVSLIDAAMPGMLPVLNEFCVRQAVKTGLGIKGKINLHSCFDRKNYFYADLPQGYQISQFFHPIVEKGSIEIDLANGEVKTIEITRIHLEQDAGKSLHEHSPRYSFIDLNRCGIALMEIVSEPQMRSSYEAAEYVKNIRSILRYLGTCDGDMEKGSFRCDANVSVRLPGDDLGTRCEIKNLNSIRNIIRAIDYEVLRQIEIIEEGGVINQETRLFDANLNETRTMRTKEDAQDYRYFPDPDLLPLVLTEEFVAEIKQTLPELPEEKKQRYIKEYHLSKYDASVLVADQETAAYFEQLLGYQVEAKLGANWITAELFAKLNKANQSINQTLITPAILAKLLKLIISEVISGKIAKQVFEMMFESGEDPEEIVNTHSLKQVTDVKELEQMVSEILSKNQDKVIEYKAGKDKLFGFFVGQIMKQSAGKANPEIINNILLQELKK